MPSDMAPNQSLPQRSLERSFSRASVAFAPISNWVAIPSTANIKHLITFSFERANSVAELRAEIGCLAYT